MKIPLGAVGADAWAMWRRDRDLLIAIAGPFLFLPTLALLVLVPAAPKTLAPGADEVAMAAFLSDYVAWARQNILWFAIGGAMSLYGTLILTFLYLDRSVADVRAAMLAALPLLPRYALAMLVVAIPASIGLFAFVLPGLYVLGRTILVAPAMTVERPLSAIAAIRRSMALTRGNGLTLAGVSGIALLAGQVLPAPLLAIDDAMRSARVANPIVVVLIDSGAAALASAIALALILFRIALYRRVGASSGI